MGPLLKSCGQNVTTELRIGQLGNVSFILVFQTRLSHSTRGLMSDGAASPLLLGDPLEPREKSSLGRRDNWNRHTPLLVSFAIHCLKRKRKLTWWVREGGVINGWPKARCTLEQSTERTIRHFRVHLSLHFKARLSAKSCYENQFSFILKLELIIITKAFALRLALKERLRGTRKWPIVIVNWVKRPSAHLALKW